MDRLDEARRRNANQLYPGQKEPSEKEEEEEE